MNNPGTTFKSVLIVSLVLFLSSLKSESQTVAVNYTAYKPGEELNYNIHYGFVNAASAVLKVDNNYKVLNNKAHYFISAISKTSSNWDWFYKVRDNFYTAVDTATLYPAYAIRDIHEGDYQTMDKIIFNRTDNTINSNGKIHKATVKLFDIISAVYYARCIDFSKIAINQEIPVYTFFDDQFFPVGLKYMGKEILETKFGKFRCLVIKPKLVQGRIFKGQYDMTIYVTDDENHLPLKVQTAIFVGYIQAELISFKNLKYKLSSKIA